MSSSKNTQPFEGTGLTEENIKARNKAEKRLKRRLRKEVRDYISSSRRTDSYRKSIQTEEVLNYLTTTKHPSFNDIAFYFDNNTFFLGEEKDAFNSLPLTSQTTNEIKTTLNRYLSHLRRDIEKNNNIENHRKTDLQDALLDIFVCALSNKFKGTYYSSFSQFIELIRRDNNIKNNFHNNPLLLTEKYK